MSKKYKVYFDERFVLFTDRINTSVIEQKYSYKFENSKQISHLISTFIQNTEVFSIAIVHNDVKAAFKAWKNELKYIKAAGGLVQNSKGECMFIFRLDKWDLPKGKMDKGETPEITAIREVEEETGLQKLSIKKELKSTYHTYTQNGVFILKRTYWFAMIAKDDSNAKPQLEENITQLKWFSPEGLVDVIANTYPSIKDVILSHSF